jgi:hypothetical protein
MSLQAHQEVSGADSRRVREDDSERDDPGDERSLAGARGGNQICRAR